MIGRKSSSLLAAGAVSLGVACMVLLAGAGSALACVTDADGDCFRPNYRVQRTDGSLAEWTGPGVGHVVGWLGGNGTPVEVVCETTGAREDGQPYVVWDQLDDGSYVYGYYLDTPGDGYHPALATCSGSGGGPKPPPSGAGEAPPPGGGEGGSVGSPLNSFNAAAAADWARANATSSDNPYGYRDDCTDFVSRAMHLGGGMPNMDVQGIFPFNHADDDNWYMEWFGRWIVTYSWGSAPHLANFLRLTGWRREIGLSAAGPGDLIFVNWGTGGRDLPPGQHDTSGPTGIDHVGMIVGNPGRRSGYNIQIAQHTPNKIEKLSDWRNYNPHMHFWIYSIYY